MKATTRNMAEAITQALGPVFHANPDYKTITEAIALTVARVAQSTVDRGFEHRELDDIYAMASHALTQFLNEEEALLEAKAKVLVKGVDGFAEMFGPANGLAAINGGVSPEACAEAEEFAGQDHDQWGGGGPMAAKHLDPKDDELEGPEHTKASWSNSPIHQEIARFEQEHPNRDDGYNPDGPRAYL